MSSLLNVVPDFQMTRTANGSWRRYLYTNGAVFSEFTSRRSIRGWPIIQIVHGRSPETGRMTAARGIIAIGQIAVRVFGAGQQGVWPASF